MLGRSHIICHSATALSVCASCVSICGYQGNTQVVKAIATSLREVLISMQPNLSIMYVFWAAAFLFGSLLPDCDSEHSYFGRHVAWSGEHRGILHMIYPVLVMFGCLYFERVVFGFAKDFEYIILCVAFGYILHLFFDSFSRMGICWFRNDWRYVGPKRIKVKRNHPLKLYRTGGFSEGVFVCVWVALCASIPFGLYWLCCYV